MAAQKPLLIAGATGVFGGHLLKRLLAEPGGELRVASRDIGRATALCRSLGDDRVTPHAVDLRERESLTAAAAGCTAVLCTAGPFQSLPVALPQWTSDCGAAWLDIADDATWIAGVLSSGATECTVPGLSTSPAITGALVLAIHEVMPGARHARTCLFIGNRNEKGPGVIASAMSAGLRRAGKAHLRLGGRRTLFGCPAADSELLQRAAGISAEFFVAPESVLGTRALHLLRGAGGLPQRRAAMVARLCVPISRFGTAGGMVEAEVTDGETVMTAAVSGGQDIAVEPLLVVLRQLQAGALPPRAISPLEALDASTLLAALAARGAVVAPPEVGSWRS